jgi:hypothetical protein
MDAEPSNDIQRRNSEIEADSACRTGCVVARAESHMTGLLYSYCYR